MLSNTVIGRRCFSEINKRIVLMANSNSSDVAGARFMKALRTVSGVKDFDYFGYGGKRMSKEGLHDSEVDIDHFSDKTFYTWRKTKQITKLQSETRFHSLNWINIHYKRNADGVLTLLDKSEFFKKVYRHRPSAIISLDNEYFSIEAMKRINKFYDHGSVPKPAKHYYNRFVRDFRQWHEEYFDYMHYTIPMRTAVPGGYFFPAQYVGQHGVYDALRHLMAQDPEKKHLVSDHTISLSNRHFAGDIDASIQKARRAFREKHSIGEYDTVIFVSPGNEKNEVEFSFESTRRGVEEFLLKFSAPTSLSPVAKPLENFHTVISVEHGSETEQQVKDLLSERGWHGKYTVVTDHNNEYIDAMAASDIGVAYDGQIVGMAAACHLPMMILLDMRMHHQWYHDLYNRWFNNMVTIADKDIYPELIGGQAWFGKICDTLGEWYVHPGTRFDMIRSWEYFVKDAVHKVDFSIEDTVFGENQVVVHDGKEYSQYADTFHLMATKVWADIQKYETQVGLKFKPSARILHKPAPNLY